jgi:hypothetical protein
MPRGNETITVKPQLRTDRLRDPSGSAPAEYDISGCLSWPRASLEEGKGWVGIAGVNVKAPAGSVIPRTALVELDGKTYSVDGEPQDYGRKGVIVQLTRVS